MKFFPISIEEYIKLHLADNPSENERDYRKRINSALADYKNGVKCSCGNDIWVIGSAIVEKSCFTCITGEDTPDDDYEIDSAIHKAENKIGRRHIDDMDPFQIAGIFDDDGFQINADLIKKPDLCLTCIRDNDPNEEMLCNLTRNDQKEDGDFVCFTYKKNLS
jgi:hypothetical protein